MADRYILWGWTSRWKADKGGPVRYPLRITSGSLKGCREREGQFKADYPDALTAIRPSATGAGDGLMLRVQERLNPTGPVTDDTNGCEGHADTDDALTSGAGIGEAVYCDGSCNPKGE